MEGYTNPLRRVLILKLPPCPHIKECFLEKGKIRKSKAEGDEEMTEEEFEKWLGDYQREIEKMTVKREGKREAVVGENDDWRRR